MIRRTLLIARQEFIKYVTRRGFIISLLMFPLILVLAVTIPRFTATHPRTNVMTVVDVAGGYAPAIAHAAVRDRFKAELAALADYARQYADLVKLRRGDPALAGMLQQPERGAATIAFAERGGWQPVIAELSPLVRAGAPVFTPPAPAVAVVPPPKDLAADLAAGRHGQAVAYLTGAQSPHSRRLTSIVFIPRGFGPGSRVAAQYWSVDAEQSFEFVHWALTDALRLKTIKALVPPGEQAKVTLDVDAELTGVDPMKGSRLSLTDRLAQLVPIGLAFVLFIVAFSDAALLLQSVVEEKSTRMVEVLLSCASPHEIMTGKLMGVIGLAIVTLAAWSAVLFAFASFLAPDMLAAVFEGLRGLVPMLPLVMVYFFCGLMIYASLFLGIGATSASLPDAQALIGPATLVIVLPNMLMSALIQDPNGTLARVISWIPIYTPFFMLVRLPFHPPAAELWATAALTIATTVFLIHRMGRVFARHVLTTERPPSFGKLVKGLFGASK